jgi:hypothetical protein
MNWREVGRWVDNAMAGALLLGALWLMTDCSVRGAEAKAKAPACRCSER